jgi:hypothetical protein
MKGVIVKPTWDNALHALVLIRIGQDLGTYSPASKAVHDAIELAVSVIGLFCR